MLAKIQVKYLFMRLSQRNQAETNKWGHDWGQFEEVWVWGLASMTQLFRSHFSLQLHFPCLHLRWWQERNGVKWQRGNDVRITALSVSVPTAFQLICQKKNKKNIQFVHRPNDYILKAHFFSVMQFVGLGNMHKNRYGCRKNCCWCDMFKITILLRKLEYFSLLLIKRFISFI